MPPAKTLDGAPDDVDVELKDIVEMAALACRADVGFVIVHDDDAAGIVAETGLDEVFEPLFAARVLAAGHPLLVADVADDAELGDDYPHAKHGLTSCAGASAVDAAGARVAVVVMSRARGAFEERQGAVLSRLAHAALRALRRARALRSYSPARAALHQAILDSANFAVIATDVTGHVRMLNAAAQLWLGYNIDEIYGEELEDLLDEDELVAAAKRLVEERGLDVEPGSGAFLMRARESGHDEGEWTLVGKDYRRVPVQVRTSALHDGAGRLEGFFLFAEDIRLRKVIEAQRRRATEERERLASVLEETRDIVAILDKNGMPIYANAAARKIAGLGKDLLPDDWHDVHPPWAQRKIRDEAMPALKRQGHWTGETAYVTPEGEELPVLHALAAHRGGDGEISFVSSIAHDITEQKRVERMKDQFLATVSHELRTPLTSVRGAIGLLLGGAVDGDAAQHKRLLSIAQKNCDRLISLVSELLDAEKLAAGKVRLKPRELDVAKVVSSCVEATGPYAQTAGVTFSLCASGDASVAAADPDRLAQVVANLLSNAAKFSPRGSQVDVAVEGTPAVVRVSVRDRGPGIPPEVLPRLFQRFAQGPESSKSGALGGTGLGLSICKSLVELHGGHIGHLPADGGGTVFWFELPRARAETGG